MTIFAILFKIHGAAGDAVGGEDEDVAGDSEELELEYEKYGAFTRGAAVQVYVHTSIVLGEKKKQKTLRRHSISITM